MNSGTIFAIKKYAIHDGPDIRTTVFFKGCPLSCRWCHNPEGLSPVVELLWLGDRCIGCGQCLGGCPSDALCRTSVGILRDHERCTRCGACVEICPALAHETTGYMVDVDGLMAEIERDVPFYDAAHGGVTFSGGEPLLQYKFLKQLLLRCGESGIHRAVDTSAFAPAAHLAEILDCTELFLVDLKHMNSDVHRRYTGVENGQILKNISTIAESGAELVVRIPLIPGVNCDQENLERSAAFLAGLPSLQGVDLLPYHGIAQAKYRKLGLAYEADSFRELSAEEIEECCRYFTEAGLRIQLGG